MAPKHIRYALDETSFVDENLNITIGLLLLDKYGDWARQLAKNIGVKRWVSWFQHCFEMNPLIYS